MRFSVRETKGSPDVSLEISGITFHSALVVEKIETIVEKDCLLVLVHLMFTRSGLTGNFAYDFDVPKGIDTVCFGPAKHVIWKRRVSSP